MDTSGMQTTSLQVMKDRVVDFYKKLYHYEPHSAPMFDLNISFDDAITTEIGAWLRCYPTLEEARKVLHWMSKDKALGPDGMKMEVMVHHWECVKNDLLSAILAQLMMNFSWIFIVLVPLGENNQKSKYFLKEG